MLFLPGFSSLISAIAFQSLHWESKKGNLAREANIGHFCLPIKKEGWLLHSWKYASEIIILEFFPLCEHTQSMGILASFVWVFFHCHIVWGATCFCWRIWMVPFKLWARQIFHDLSFWDFWVKNCQICSICCKTLQGNYLGTKSKFSSQNLIFGQYSDHETDLYSNIISKFAISAQR